MPLLTNCDFSPFIVDQSHCRAWCRLPRAARTHLTGLITQSDKGRLGEPHDVAPLNTKTLAPFSIHPRRQGFAAASTVLQEAYILTFRSLWRLQHRIQHCGNAEKMGRSMSEQKRKSVSRSETLPRKQGLSTSGQWQKHYRK